MKKFDTGQKNVLNEEPQILGNWYGKIKLPKKKVSDWKVKRDYKVKSINMKKNPTNPTLKPQKCFAIAR